MTTTRSTMDRYSDRTPRSRKLFDEARQVIPGGLSRGTLAFQPYPFYASRARGAYITDVDGNVYLDLINNYTSLPHGHHHAATIEAVVAELAHSSAIGTAHPAEALYARELRERLPSLQQLRFATTGSEAVAFTARVARAVTGRDRILKFEGGFHGSYGDFNRDIFAPPRPAGSSAPASPEIGIEPSTTIIGVYNDLDSVSAAFTRWGSEIAAVVVEPFMGNAALIQASEPFVDRIFEEAARHGALVVFDEIQSLRAGYHGAQGLWGRTPDLTAIGKIMGGGFPLAAFGGRADLFSVLSGTGPQVRQTGTFTAAPIALAAGRAAMAALDHDAYAELDQLTDRLRRGVREVFSNHHIPVHVNGIGSMFNISISEEPVHSYRAHRASDVALWEAIRLEMVVRGVLIMPRGTGCLSTAVTGDDVSHTLEVLDSSIGAVQG